MPVCVRPMIVRPARAANLRHHAPDYPVLLSDKEVIIPIMPRRLTTKFREKGF
jgi:hypothetical protein